jgi:hypothetical protein
MNTPMLRQNTYEFPAGMMFAECKRWLIDVPNIDPSTGRWEFKQGRFFWSPMGAESVWPKR